MKRKLIDIPEETLEKIKIKASVCGYSPKKYIERLLEEDTKELRDVSAVYGRYRLSSSEEPSVESLRAIAFEAAAEAASKRENAAREYFQKINDEINKLSYGK